MRKSLPLQWQMDSLNCFPIFSININSFHSIVYIIAYIPIMSIMKAVDIMDKHIIAIKPKKDLKGKPILIPLSEVPL